MKAVVIQAFIFACTLFGPQLSRALESYEDPHILEESLRLLKAAREHAKEHQEYTPNGAYNLLFPGLGSGTITASLNRDPKDEKYPFCPTKAASIPLWSRGSYPNTKLSQEQQLCLIENWEVSYDPKTKHYVQDAPGLNITRTGGPPADWRFGAVRMADDPSYAEVRDRHR
jgi:hypothetical protein